MPVDGTRDVGLNIGGPFRAALLSIGGGDHRRRRLVSIVEGAVSGLAGRGLGVAVNLLAVPLAVGYLGPERYGVWALVGSLLAWVRLADLGIGNGLTNAIAGALGSERPDAVRGHISTALAALSAISVLLAAAAVLAWPWIDWTALFGLKTDLARHEIGPAMAAAVALFLLGFPLSVIGRTFNAAGDGKLSNLWGMGGNVASLAALLLVTHTQGGLLMLVLAVSGTGLLVTALSGVWLFGWRRPGLAPRFRSIQPSSAGELMGVGAQFFLIQVLSLIVFETDNLMVAHFLGASEVPTYSLTYSLFNYASIIQSVLFSYVWVAYSEAIARRDIDWVRRTFRLNFAVSLAFTAAAVVPLVFIARPFIHFWTGGIVQPPLNLVLWMAVWGMINAYCSPMACLLAAASHMRAQIAYSALAAAANIVLSVNLVHRWGVSGVIAATVISYLLFICVPIAFDISVLLRKLRRPASVASQPSPLGAQ